MDPNAAKTSGPLWPEGFFTSTRPGRCSKRVASKGTTPFRDPEPVPCTWTGVLKVICPLSIVASAINVVFFSCPLVRSTAWMWNRYVPEAVNGGPICCFVSVTKYIVFVSWSITGVPVMPSVGAMVLTPISPLGTGTIPWEGSV